MGFTAFFTFDVIFRILVLQRKFWRCSEKKIRGVFKEYIEAETQLLDLGVWDKNGRCWGSETKTKVWRIENRDEL